MNVKFYMRCRMATGWKFLENFWCTLQKIYAFSMQYTKTFASFCYHFLQNFIFQQKVNWKFVLVFSQNFSCNLETSPCTLFIITCNQKLNNGYKLFISRTFFIKTIRNFYRCFFPWLCEWLFKEFVTEFSLRHWNTDEKNWTDLSERKNSCQVVGNLIISREYKQLIDVRLKFVFGSDWLWIDWQ